SGPDGTSGNGSYGALARTQVIGTCKPRAPSFLSNWQTLSALMYVKLVTVITSCVMAWSAPSTLKRCRPLGALIQHRAKHQRYPRNAPKTNCAASTKKTARLP